MATTRFLLIPVTLCCFLFVLAVAEQSNVNSTLLVAYGTAKCKSNSSRIITNTRLQLVIKNATVAGGTVLTTSDGQIVMTVKLNSAEQLAALMSNGAFLTAPPHACGAPRLPAGTVVAAALRPMATVTISDDDAGISVQRPTIATSDTLLVPGVNKGDVVRCVVAAVERLACVAISI